MSWFRSLHGPLAWLLCILIIVVVIALVAIVVAALGGFDWHFNVGHFHWDFGVTKS